MEAKCSQKIGKFLRTKLVCGRASQHHHTDPVPLSLSNQLTHWVIGLTVTCGPLLLSAVKVSVVNTKLGRFISTRNSITDLFVNLRGVKVVDDVSIFLEFWNVLLKILGYLTQQVDQPWNFLLIKIDIETHCLCQSRTNLLYLSFFHGTSRCSYFTGSKNSQTGHFSKSRCLENNQMLIKDRELLMSNCLTV